MVGDRNKIKFLSMIDLLPPALQSRLKAAQSHMWDWMNLYPGRATVIGLIVIGALIMALIVLPKPPQTDQDPQLEALEQRAREGLLGE